MGRLLKYVGRLRPGGAIHFFVKQSNLSGFRIVCDGTIRTDIAERQRLHVWKAGMEAAGIDPEQDCCKRCLKEAKKRGWL